MKKTLAALSMIVLSTATVYATTFTTQDNVRDNLFLYYSGVSGSFDLSSQLQGSQYNTPYLVNSGMAQFNFSDNYDQDYESATVTIASGSKTWNSPQVVWGYDTRWYVSGSEYICTSRNTWGDCTGGYVQYYYSSYQVPIYGNTGAGSLTFLFDMNNNPGLTSDLSNDGKVSFTVNSQGSTYFQNAMLQADITPNPVPEPSTVALLGIGGMAVALYTRKRRSKK